MTHQPALAAPATFRSPSRAEFLLAHQRYCELLATINALAREYRLGEISLLTLADFQALSQHLHHIQLHLGGCEAAQAELARLLDSISSTTPPPQLLPDPK
ncbi:MAG: hypothetical protein WCQ21_15910 [Verrucomicrobiota bacterium]|jgi:hypothetical protein